MGRQAEGPCRLLSIPTAAAASAAAVKGTAAGSSAGVASAAGASATSSEGESTWTRHRLGGESVSVSLHQARSATLLSAQGSRVKRAGVQRELTAGVSLFPFFFLGILRDKLQTRQ